MQVARLNLSSVKSDLFPDEIYVFTPEGRIVETACGRDPVDFAYAVHTDIGHACVGARVDRQPYPLSRSPAARQSKSSPHRAHVKRGWLNFVVSSKRAPKSVGC